MSSSDKIKSICIYLSIYWGVEMLYLDWCMYSLFVFIFMEVKASKETKLLMFWAMALYIYPKTHARPPASTQARTLTITPTHSQKHSHADRYTHTHTLLRLGNFVDFCHLEIYIISICNLVHFNLVCASEKSVFSSSALVICFFTCFDWEQGVGYSPVNMGDMIFPTKIFIYEDAQSFYLFFFAIVPYSF